MRVPVSWLTEHVELEGSSGPDDIDPQAIAEALIRVGFEVEALERLETATGPLVVGHVREIEELTGFKKPIRFCRVDVGEDTPRGIVCGATNFAVGDLVVAALPGTTLPGGFAIAARTTYGHTSDGMICALDEVGLGDDHAGIIVLPPGTASPGDDAVALLGLGDTVLDVAVNPDRGYALSIRGMARELACAFDAPYGDPAMADHGLPTGGGDAWPVRLDPAASAKRFVARRATGLDPTAPTPWWMRRRLLLCGVRPISLAVDVTNYVMIELGQPMHAYDAAALTGEVVVRRARADEKITTLDDASRALDADDVVVTDDSGPIGLAGVMGGASTEVGPSTVDVLLEAATWDAPSVGRTSRRHKLSSEASRRFERDVDPAVAPAAADRAAWLLAHYAGATITPDVTDEGGLAPLTPILLPIDLPDRVAGVRYAPGAVVRRLVQVGCAVEVVATAAAADPSGQGATGQVAVTPPSWRPDLSRPADLVEEVLRLEGYDSIPSLLPAAHPGSGLTAAQRRRRQVSHALADAGYSEVLPSPFVDPAVWDAFGLDADDPRRRAVRLANPLDADRAVMATTLLPGLLDAVVRNVSRGLRDLALFHLGQVVRPEPGPADAPEVPQPGVDARPSDAEIRALLDALPPQPQRVGAVLAGAWERRGWWGDGRSAGWAEAVDAARLVAGVYGATLEVSADRHAPWHPGRCAALRVDGALVGHAGELHPKVLEALGLPPRTCAMEIELDRLPLVEVLPAPQVSSYPPVLLDVALAVAADVPVASVAAALEEGGGALVEDVRLFDVYTGTQVGEGKRSLAFALRLRATDRTLTLEEASAVRDTAVALAADRFGATLR